MHSTSEPNSTEHYALRPPKHSARLRVGVRREQRDCDICHSWPWCKPAMQAASVWWPIRESVWVLARARGPGRGKRVTSRAAVCSAGLGSIKWAWRSRASWRAMIRAALMSRMSHSQSQEEAMLACWRMPLVLIINYRSLYGVGAVWAYCSFALSCICGNMSLRLKRELFIMKVTCMIFHVAV